jgi:hypothetical protein
VPPWNWRSLLCHYLPCVPPAFVLEFLILPIRHDPGLPFRVFVAVYVSLCGFIPVLLVADRRRRRRWAVVRDVMES